MNPKAIFGLFKDTFKEWSNDKAARLGASLAYYNTIFSLGPLLLIVISIATFFLNDPGTKDQIVGTISGVIGENGGKAISETIDNANKGGGNIIATIIGIVTLLLGASGVFGQLKDALNTIWEVKPKPNLGFLTTVKNRFFSFTMVLGTGFLLMVSLVISAAVAALGKFLGNFLPGGVIVGQILNFLLAFAIITVMFALLFKFVPDVKIKWKDVWLGAAFTSLLFALGQFALGLYLSLGNVGSAFGAAGSLVIVLVWIYYSAQIMFLGAEFTQVYTNRYGSRVRPDENAEFATEEDRAEQGMAAGDDKGSTAGLGKDRKRGEQSGKGDDPARKKLKTSPWFS